MSRPIAAHVAGLSMIAEIEQHGVERFLEELAEVLRRNEYRAQAVLRRYIPKATLSLPHRATYADYLAAV